MSEQTLQDSVSSVNLAFEPFLDRVLVKVIKPEKETKAGVYLPKNNDLTVQADVIAVGTGYYTQTGEFVKIGHLVQPGNRILVFPKSGMDMTFQGEEYKLITVGEILGKVHG